MLEDIDAMLTVPRVQRVRLQHWWLVGRGKLYVSACELGPDQAKRSDTHNDDCDWKHQR